MNTLNTDRIETSVLLRAPRAKVWRALTDAEEFGSWFGVSLTGTFDPGARVRGTITHKGYEGMAWEVVIERMEPERLFAWSWHPYAVEPDVDYSTEPPTCIVFGLEAVDNGTMLTLVESGFDRLPPARRAKAYPMHEQGWAEQMKSIERHVAGKAA